MADNLEKYLDRPVRELAAVLPLSFAPAAAERHRIYANLLMALTSHYWCGNKYGSKRVYPLNPPTNGYPDSEFLDGSYLGHNIAALAVDGNGEVIDFDFNHNEAFNSSVEHAESRLLRRVFSLGQLSDTWDLHDSENADQQYGSMLSNVTVYTSLESCSQCSGIMTLAGVKEVVYLQDDPQMYRIGNILRRLTETNDPKETYLQAPLPVPGVAVGLPAYAELNAALDDFRAGQVGKVSPFAISADGTEKFTGSITSFLCTERAFEVFRRGKPALMELKASYDASSGGNASFRPHDGALTNAEALAEAMDFLKYGVTKGRRGTPHR